MSESNDADPMPNHLRKFEYLEGVEETLRPDNQPVPTQGRRYPLHKDMREPPFPPLGEHLRFLRLEGFPELGIKTYRMLNDLAKQFVDLAKGHKVLNEKKVSYYNQGRTEPIPREHLVALHKAFRLDRHFASFEDLWGIWPMSGKARDFVPRPLDEFKKLVLDAKNKTPNLVAQVRALEVDPSFTVSLRTERLASFYVLDEDKEEDEIDIRPATVLRIGDKATLFCSTPGPGYLAFIHSALVKHESSGARDLCYLRMNPHLKLKDPLRNKRIYEAGLPAAQGPVSDYQLLALFWPLTKGYPPSPIRWAFPTNFDLKEETRDHRLDLCERTQLDAVLAAMLEMRQACSPSEPRPEVTAITYFVTPNEQFSKAE